MVVVFLAEGFEEIEALTPVDLLRRAGIDVLTVGIGSKVVTGAHGIPIVTDCSDAEYASDASPDMVVLPGGMPGTKNLEASEVVRRAIEDVVQRGTYLAAICAAPSILGKLGLLQGKKATCFPGFEPTLTGAILSSEPVCVDGRLITSKGAGTALAFSLKLVELLTSDTQARELAAVIQCG